MYTVEKFFESYREVLGLSLCGGESGLQQSIVYPEVQRPGLSLTGYLKNYSAKRMLLFGKVEMGYLNELSESQQKERLEAILPKEMPAVVVARNLRPPLVLKKICEKREIPLFRSPHSASSLFSKILRFLSEDLAKRETLHGTLIEAFGVGVLIQGESSIGKSEAALGLIERGHRLISDDVVEVRVREEQYVAGSGPELSRHMMEIRGIGIINVAHLYGAVCVRDEKSIDLVVKLEAWDNKEFYDRIGLEEKYCEILSIRIPYLVLPVKPGRDVVLLIETIALNHRLKALGYHSAKEFNAKLIETITRRQKAREGVARSARY